MHEPEPSKSSVVTNLQGQIDELRERIDLVAEGKAWLSIDLKYPSGEPVSNIKLTSPKASDGTDVYTDENGHAEFYMLDPRDDVEISVKYSDMFFSTSKRVIAGSITKVSGIVSLTETVDVTSSGKTFIFSKNVSEIEYVLCGAGAGGNNSLPNNSNASSAHFPGAGGGGGNVIHNEHVKISAYTEYPITIGAKGIGLSFAHQTATAGGASSAFGVTANGGYVNGGGAGGNASKNGADGTGGGVYMGISLGGSGGGGGYGWIEAGGNGYINAGRSGGKGSVNGGNGGNHHSSGSPARGYGGGGGGGSTNVDQYSTWTGTSAGDGGSGFLRVKFTLNQR